MKKAGEFNLAELSERFRFMLHKSGGSQKDFAEKCETAGSYINNIIAGQKVPGGKIYQAIKKNMPEWNLDWVISGEGPMYTAMEPEPGGRKALDDTEEVSVSSFVTIINKQLSIIDTLTETNKTLADTNNNQTQVISAYIENTHSTRGIRESNTEHKGDIGRTIRARLVPDTAPH